MVATDQLLYIILSAPYHTETFSNCQVPPLEQFSYLLPLVDQKSALRDRFKDVRTNYSQSPESEENPRV